MFASIRKAWREARGPGIAREVADLTTRFAGAHVGDRDLAKRSFESCHSYFSDAWGPVAHWSQEQLAFAHKQMLTAARQNYAARGGAIEREMNQASGIGAGLLCLFYEARSLPGNAGAPALSEIEEWIAANSVDL